MKIAIIEKYGDVEVLKIVQREVPTPKSGEVLVQVKAAALNPKDILIRKGKFKLFTGRRFPQFIGFDFAGIIVDSNYGELQDGDRVFGMLNGWKGGSCAEYVNVKCTELCMIPDSTTFEEAASFPLVGQTALQAMRKVGNLRDGQKILINGGSGGVGTISIQMAKLLGAEVTTISSSKNEAFCKSLGADQALSYEVADVLRLDQEFDIFFDVYGNYSFKQVKKLLTPKGMYITTVPKAEILKEQFLNLLRWKKARLVIVHSNSNDLIWLRKRIGEQKIIPVIDKVYDFEDMRLAQKHIESKRTKGKVILKI